MDAKGQREGSVVHQASILRWILSFLAVAFWCLLPCLYYGTVAKERWNLLMVMSAPTHR